MGKIALFDLEGTLVDSLEAVALAAHKTAKELGHDYTLEETTKFATDYTLLKRLGTTSTIFWPIFDTHYRDVREHIEKGRIKLYSDTHQALQQLNEIKAGIISDSPQHRVDFFMDNFDLRQYFGSIKGWYKGRADKPGISVVVEALQEMNWQGEDLYIIGDSPVDIKCGEAFEHVTGRKVRTILMERVPRENLFPDLRTNSLVEAIEYIKRN
jgi:HAD superfamily hydrolase (TIGR01549 family)